MTHEHKFEEIRRVNLPIERENPTDKVAIVYQHVIYKCNLCIGDLVAFKEVKEKQGAVPIDARGNIVRI